MKISAVYIARNEEKNIKKSLQSIADSIDELILVDTGSTDKTKEVFESFGGQVYEKKWENDFSYPRNLAISKATGDWLIILDADEYFTEETRGNIRSYLKTLDSSINGLLIEMNNIDVENNAILDHTTSLRIVRNMKGLKYYGRIHEELRYEGGSIPNLKRVNESVLKLIHTGYSSNISERKCQRNLEILKEEIAQGRPIEELYMYLAETYNGLNDVENMLKYAHLDVDFGRRKTTYASRSYRILLEYYSKNGSVEKRLNLAKKAVEDFPELPEFQAEYGACLCNLYEYSKALDRFNMALEQYKDYSGLEPSLMTREDIKLLAKDKKKLEKYAQKEKSLKISACLICKNEEKNISDWLENVKVFADEIIVVDTGSTDNTLSIIKENNVQCYEIKWENDFASAKNFALDKARGNYIVFTDTDETFYHPERVRGFIAYMAMDTRADVSLLPLSNIDISNNNLELYRSNVARIFKNDKSIRYFGKIHESLGRVGDIGGASSLAKILGDDRLRIKHTGYSNRIVREKIYRNLSVLKDEIARSGLQERHYMYLAVSYYELADYQKALKYSILGIESDVQAIGQESDMFYIVALCLEKLEYSFDARKAFLENAINKFPQLPDFYAFLAFLLLERPDDASAKVTLELLEKTEAMAEKIKLASHYTYLRARIYFAFGRANLILGNISEAIEYYKKSLKIKCWNEEAIMGLADIFDNKPKEKFIRILSEFYDLSDAKPILANIFEANGAVKLAEAFCDLPIDKEYEMLFQKNYQSALQNAVNQSAIYLQYLFVCLLGKKEIRKDLASHNQLELLPESLKRIVLVYHGELKSDIKEQYGDYMAMLTIVLRINDDAIIEKYIVLAHVFSIENKIQIAKSLCEKEKWQLVVNILSEIPNELVRENGEFYLMQGIASYQIGNYELAKKLLKNAHMFKDSLNKKQINELRAYEMWCREVLS